MARYAIVATDTGLIHGCHGLLQSLRYYGAEADVDFYYLYWPGTDAETACHEGLYDFYTNFKPVRFVADIFPPEYAAIFADAPNACYSQRWAYAGALDGYEAVSVWDLDLLMLQDPRPWFRVAAATGMFATPANDYSGYELETGQRDLPGIQGDASPPLHNQPSFWSNDAWGAFMRDLPLKAIREKRSDITTLSRKIIEEGLESEVLVLPNALFLATHYYRQRYVRREIGDKWYVGLHENGDRVTAIHRRWWIPYICQRFLDDIGNPADRAIGLNNLRLFHELYHFFNFELENPLPPHYESRWEIRPA